MPLQLSVWSKWSLIFISALLYFYIGYVLDRSNFSILIVAFSVLFIVYYLQVKRAENNSIFGFQLVGILLRLIFLLSIPKLSDDYFRFIWDGHLLSNGLNPFHALPTDVALDFTNKDALLDGMNSPNYYTVYPPLAQWIYGISAYLSPQSIFGSIISMRAIILLAEIGNIMLLPRLLGVLKMDVKNALWYILNPLVIVELTGNLHFEGIVIFFFLLSLFLLIRSRFNLAMISWAFSAATKLIPIFLMPILISKFGLKKSIQMGIVMLAIFIILWVPFLDARMFSNFLESINLYYATFEFNASIYYLVRWIGYQTEGYNIIATAGSWLSKIALLGVFVLLINPKNKSWGSAVKSILLALTLYYALALIIHPWYITFLVFFACLTPYRYAYLWSFLAILSYWAYSNTEFNENFILIALEYLLVFTFMIYEILNQNKQLRAAKVAE